MAALLACGLLVLATGCGTARRGPSVVEAIAVENERLRIGQIGFYRDCNMYHVGGGDGLGPALNNKLLPAVADPASSAKWPWGSYAGIPSVEGQRR
jgi:hypothetical protein